MEFNISMAKAMAAFFAALRNNALAGIAFSVIVLLAYVLHLSAVIVASSSQFLYFAGLAAFVVVMSLAVLVIVSQHKVAVKG